MCAQAHMRTCILMVPTPTSMYSQKCWCSLILLPPFPAWTTVMTTMPS